MLIDRQGRWCQWGSSIHRKFLRFSDSLDTNYKHSKVRLSCVPSWKIKEPQTRRNLLWIPLGSPFQNVNLLGLILYLYSLSLTTPFQTSHRFSFHKSSAWFQGHGLWTRRLHGWTEGEKEWRNIRAKFLPEVWISQAHPIYLPIFFSIRTRMTLILRCCLWHLS